VVGVSAAFYFFLIVYLKKRKLADDTIVSQDYFSNFAPRKWAG